jgi:hypothetical protein
MINFSFLAIGKTGESKEAVEFKKYIGVGASTVLAVNPTKAELEKIYGTDNMNEPEYLKEDDKGKAAFITFIVKTDPDQCGGVETINRLMFTLRNTPAYNKDQTKVQVIDDYGNSTWASVEDAKAGKKLLSSSGKELKIAPKYRIACTGEADLVSFLKTYLCVDDAFNYVNGSWVLKDNASDYLFSLEHIKDYFKGDFSEIKEAIALQPNNKVKLLYGVRTTDEGKQYQAIAARDRFFLRNSAGSKAYERLEKELANVKQNGGWANTEYRVQELAEYNVEATNLNDAPLNDSTESEDDLPWS